MRKLIALLLIFTLSSSIWAQDELSPLSRLNQNLDLKLKLLSTVVQTNQKLELLIENYPVQVEGEISASFVSDFEKVAREHFHNQGLLVRMGESDQKLLKKIFSKLNWHELSILYLKMWQKMKAMSRAKGMGLVAALILTNIFNWVAPYFLTMLGQPAIGAIIFATPLNPPTIFLHHVVTRYQMKREITKVLGGSAAYKEYLKQERTIKEALSLRDQSHFFIALDADSSELAVARRKSLKRTALKLFGINPSGIDTTSLRDFLVEHKLEESSFMSILNDKNLDEDVRLATTLHEFFSSENEEVIADFKLKYSDFLLTKKPSAVELDELSKWISDILKTKSDQDIFLLLDHAPRGIHPYHIISTWEQIILPALAAGEQLNYRQMRGLVNGFRSFKIYQELKLSEITSSSVVSDMKAYFRTSTTNRRHCFKSSQEVINLLLAN